MKKDLICKVLLTFLVSIFLSVSAIAQQVSVKGIVQDATGEPLIGANVLVKGTTNGTVTDIDGLFQLSAPAGATIVVSYVGYITQEKAIPSPLSQMTFVLSDDTKMLEEVVVIGYGSVKKTDLTGSVTAIKAEELNRGVVTSPDQMLQGKVPGLLVTPASGDPTGSATIRIRGAASLYANNDPLIVIDGVPITPEGGAGMSNPLASVNPNDIESYTVLKDASATAIYGSRASNGVIIITTKKGTGNTVQVAYNSSYSVKQNTRTLDVMTGDQYRDYVAQAYAGTTRLENIQKLMGTANTNWQDLIYRTALTVDQNISVYGNANFGEVKMPYRVSGGYVYDEATLKVGDNQRANLSLSLTPTFLKDHLSVNINAKGIYNKANYPSSDAISDALNFSPTVSPYFGAGDTRCNSYFNWLSSDGTANTMASVNPLSDLFDNYNKNNTYRSFGNAQFDYKVHGFEDLRFNLNLGYDFSYTSGATYEKVGSITAMRNGTENYYHDYTNQNSNTLLEFYGDYNHEFDKHHVDLMAGYSWQHNYVKYNSVYSYNVDDAPGDIYLKEPTDRREYYLLSFFGRFNYSYDSRYLLTVSLRDDASSRFSKDNRWGLFPSAALAWNLANESFIKDADNSIFSTLKLRLGWGKTGQQDIGMDRCYAYMPKYTSSSANTTQIFWNGKYYYTIAPNAYNADIKWETTETYNVGIDFGFLNGRINGSVEAYIRKTTDLLNDITTPMGTNFSNKVIANVGDMENKGIEVNLNFVPIETKDWRWTLNVNGTFQRTKITKLTNTADPDYLGVQVGSGMSSIGGYTSLYRVGYTPYTYYLFQQAYDENGKAIENVLVDRNGDGVITEDDRYVTGKSILPKVYGGVSSQLTYKKWDFGFNGHFSIGGYALNKVHKNNATSYSDDHTKGYINNLSTYVLETGWTSAMSEYQQFSDMFLENASFFRMDDINLGYTFDEIGNWNGKIRVSASVQNVFTITKYKGLDPELTSQDGVDDNIIPRPRLYTLRLNINF